MKMTAIGRITPSYQPLDRAKGLRVDRLQVLVSGFVDDVQNRRNRALPFHHIHPRTANFEDEPGNFAAVQTGLSVDQQHIAHRLIIEVAIKLLGIRDRIIFSLDRPGRSHGWHPQREGRIAVDLQIRRSGSAVVRERLQVNEQMLSAALRLGPRLAPIQPGQQIGSGERSDVPRAEQLLPPLEVVFSVENMLLGLRRAVLKGDEIGDRRIIQNDRLLHRAMGVPLRIFLEPRQFDQRFSLGINLQRYVMARGANHLLDHPNPIAIFIKRNATTSPATRFTLNPQSSHTVYLQLLPFYCPKGQNYKSKRKNLIKSGGGVAERLKAAVLKTAKGESPS